MRQSGSIRSPGVQMVTAPGGNIHLHRDIGGKDKIITRKSRDLSGFFYFKSDCCLITFLHVN
jgi:hypothetical protein